MRTASSTFFIPCSNVEASSALYALNLIKRCSYNVGLASEINGRESHLYRTIFQETISGFESSGMGFFARFNFIGKYVSADNRDGLLLTFFADNVGNSINQFSPTTAVLFCQALIKCFHLTSDVEIANFSFDGRSYQLLGSVNVSRDDFEMLSAYPHLLFAPITDDEPPQDFYTEYNVDHSVWQQSNAPLSVSAMI